MARHPVPIQLVDVFGSALENGAITVVEHDSATPVDLYDADVGGSVITQPALTDRYGELEAWTDFAGLIDVIYEETDETTDARDRRRHFDTRTKTWEVGLTSDAYLEFLADAQTPYYIQASGTNADHPYGVAAREWWIGARSKFTHDPAPSAPLGALVDPYLGPGIVTDPIGYYPPNRYYDGPGICRFLKTGVYALNWFFQVELTTNPWTDSMPTASFDIFAENGVNQKGRVNTASHGNRTLPTSPMTPNWINSNRPWWGHTTTITVVEEDRITGSPYTNPTWSYPGVLMMEQGVVPLGWDCYPTFQLLHSTASVENFQMDHLGMEIRKIA